MGMSNGHPDRSAPFRWFRQASTLSILGFFFCKFFRLEGVDESLMDGYCLSLSFQTMVTIEINCRDIPFFAVGTEFIPSFKEIKRLTLSENYKIFSDAELWKDLFPEKYFSVDFGSWLPILTNETNLRHVAMHRDVTASFSPEGVTSITFCTIYQLVPTGSRVLVWCYGSKLTPKMVITHAQFCLGNMTSFPPLCEDDVSVGIMFPTHVNKQDVENYFLNKGMVPVLEQSKRCGIIEHVLKHWNGWLRAELSHALDTALPVNVNFLL